MKNEEDSSFLGSVVNIFTNTKKKQEVEIDLRHERVLSALDDLLNFPDTTIDVDQFASKYYVENQDLHVTYCVIGNSNVIMMVNTHDNVEKKFHAKIVQSAVDRILKEKNKRMELKFLRMEKRSDSMIERISSVIKKERVARLPSEATI